jgi:Na+-transporting NADH:ubiquinone oxidoreductase subunit A
MKSRLIQLSLIAGFLLSSFPLMAQDGASGQSYLVYIMLAVAIIIFLGLIIQVSDNLLAIEARNMGAEKKSSVGLFPRPGEIFPKKLPKYVDGDKAIRSSYRGYNISAGGFC